MSACKGCKAKFKSFVYESSSRKSRSSYPIEPTSYRGQIRVGIAEFVAHGQADWSRQAGSAPFLWTNLTRLSDAKEIGTHETSGRAACAVLVAAGTRASTTPIEAPLFLLQLELLTRTRAFGWCGPFWSRKRLAVAKLPGVLWCTVDW